MKNLSLALLAALLLSACGNTNSTPGKAEYKLELSPIAMERYDDAIESTKHVIESRMKALKDMTATVSFDQDEGFTRMTVTSLSDGALADLELRLAEPFTFDIMLGIEDREAADVIVAEREPYAKTGITGQDLVWLTSEETEMDGQKFGAVTLKFTEDGRSKLHTLFSENEGGIVGLFVRGLLHAKLLIDTPDLKDEVVINAIPSYDIAKVFADDVNVGLNVTFLPL